MPEVSFNKTFFMSDMCLAGKNKKGEKSSTFFFNFLNYNTLFYVCMGGKIEKKTKKLFTIIFYFIDSCYNCSITKKSY